MLRDPASGCTTASYLRLGFQVCSSLKWVGLDSKACRLTFLLRAGATWTSLVSRPRYVGIYMIS